MNEQLAREVADWHLNNGGYCDTPEVFKHHTLRILNEAVELCLATGAQQQDIFDVCSTEINKHAGRSSPGEVDLEEIPGEIADVAILLELFAGYTEISIDDVVHDKLQVLHERKWKADTHGVLWRDKDLESGGQT